METEPAPRAPAPGLPTEGAADAGGAVADAARAEPLLRVLTDAWADATVIARAHRAPSGAILGFTVLDGNRRAAALARPPGAALAGAELLERFPAFRDWGVLAHCCAVVAMQRPLARTLPSPVVASGAAEPRWRRWKVIPLGGDTVAIATRDVTARRRRRRALAASEARHRELFEHNGAIQLLADAETASLVDVNPAAEAFYGWSRETMRGMRAADFEAITVEQWRAEMARIATGTGQRVIREHRTAGGGLRQVEAHIGAVELDGRRVLHIIIQDVSDRVRAERQLRESEARFRAVLDSMRDGVVVHDASGTIRIWNPAAERILGLSGAQLLGLAPFTRDWEAVRVDGTPWAEDTHPEMEALRTGRPQPPVLMGLRRGNGEFAWIQVTSDPLFRDGDPRPAGAVSVFADVTGRRD